MLAEAIEKKVKVYFYYYSYGTDKKLHRRKEEQSLVNPYGLFLKNGHYYLVCNFNKYDNHSYCRVDKVTDIVLTEQPVKPLAGVKGFEDGISLGKINNRLPYMFDEEPTRIEFITANSGENMIDNVLDWFGRDVQITELSDGNFKFSLVASPRAMRFWILQFGKYVKVLSPQSLVDKIKDDINEMKKLYEG